jgi:hypothetical protein
MEPDNVTVSTAIEIKDKPFNITIDKKELEGPKAKFHVAELLCKYREYFYDNHDTKTSPRFSELDFSNSDAKEKVTDIIRNTTGKHTGSILITQKLLDKL